MMNRREFKIKEASNGYIITIEEIGQNREIVCHNSEELFQKLLYELEGRSPEGAGDRFGTVRINRQSGKAVL